MHKRRAPMRPKGGRGRGLSRGRGGPFSPRPPQTRKAASRVGPLATADELDVKLRYVVSDRLYNAAGGGTSREWTPNAAYDVDPLLGSTETSGFDEYALLYSYYRVTGYRYKLEAVSRETDAIVVYLFNTNTSITGSAYDVLSGNPYSHIAQLGYYTGGAAKATFSGYMSCAKLLGSNAVESADSLRALTTAAPTDLLLLTVAIQSDSGIGTLPNGISYVLTITMDIRFYGRRFDLTIAATEARLLEIKKARNQHKLRKQEKALEPSSVKH